PPEIRPEAEVHGRVESLLDIFRLSRIQAVPDVERRQGGLRRRRDVSLVPQYEIAIHLSCRLPRVSAGTRRLQKSGSWAGTWFISPEHAMRVFNLTRLGVRLRRVS